MFVSPEQQNEILAFPPINIFLFSYPVRDICEIPFSDSRLSGFGGSVIYPQLTQLPRASRDIFALALCRVMVPLSVFSGSACSLPGWVQRVSSCLRKIAV